MRSGPSGPTARVGSTSTGDPERRLGQRAGMSPEQLAAGAIENTSATTLGWCEGGEGGARGRDSKHENCGRSH